MKRREIIKQLAAVPIFGSLAAKGGYHVPQNPVSILDREGESIYDALGIDTIINCRGTFTILGGSIELPEVIEALEAASGNFVQYDELANGIGRRLAEITQSEWGMVSSGCAAGLKHVTAACVTDGNPEKLIRIPDLNGFDKTEVIIPRTSRNVYDHAVRNVGVKMVTVDTPDEMQKAIGPQTAMIYLALGKHTEKGEPLSLEKVAEIAAPHGIPILADAAAENLTVPPIHLARGATVVAYSGGKAIRGPQCAGLLLGRKDLLMSAWQASSPHHGPGRDNKVGKEEMIGMLAAVEAWIKRDHEAEWQRWLEWLNVIGEKMRSLDGVKTEITDPTGLSNHAPVLHIKWDPKQFHLTGYEMAEEVGRNKPRVAIGHRDLDHLTSVNITPNQMQSGEAETVAQRLYQVLATQRSPRNQTLAKSSINLTGHWKVNVEFLSGTSEHYLFLQQEDNWIEGIHQTDFEKLDLVGMVEGSNVKLKSAFHVPGNHLIYLFSGKGSEGSFEGSIFLGEYLTARFSARRIQRKGHQKPILIPGGPPLAT